MPDRRTLADFTTPIASGLTEAPGGGRLNPERSALLAAQLRALSDARRDAWAELRSGDCTIEGKGRA